MIGYYVRYHIIHHRPRASNHNRIYLSCKSRCWVSHGSAHLTVPFATMGYKALSPSRSTTPSILPGRLTTLSLNYTSRIVLSPSTPHWWNPAGFCLSAFTSWKVPCQFIFCHRCFLGQHFIRLPRIPPKQEHIYSKWAFFRVGKLIHTYRQSRFLLFTFTTTGQDDTPGRTEHHKPSNGSNVKTVFHQLKSHSMRSYKKNKGSKEDILLIGTRSFTMTGYSPTLIGSWLLLNYLHIW